MLHKHTHDGHRAARAEVCTQRTRRAVQISGVSVLKASVATLVTFKKRLPRSKTCFSDLKMTSERNQEDNRDEAAAELLSSEQQQP